MKFIFPVLYSLSPIMDLHDPDFEGCFLASAYVLALCGIDFPHFSSCPRPVHAWVPAQILLLSHLPPPFPHNWCDLLFISVFTKKNSAIYFVQQCLSIIELLCFVHTKLQEQRGRGGTTNKHLQQRVRWCPSPCWDCAGLGILRSGKLPERSDTELCSGWVGREQTEKCSDRRNGLCAAPEEKGWCFQRWKKSSVTWE